VPAVSTSEDLRRMFKNQHATARLPGLNRRTERGIATANDQYVITFHRFFPTLPRGLDFSPGQAPAARNALAEVIVALYIDVSSDKNIQCILAERALIAMDRNL
jgi:hypothetical protein